MDFSDEDNDEICFYTPKYGFNSFNSISFDDHSILGSNYLYYKPEKIIFWTNDKGEITGIQTWFRNIVDNNYINTGENKGLLSTIRHIFNIKPKEYLINCRIWKKKKRVNKIYLETNQANAFEIGIDEGEEISIDYMKYGENKIIISFSGSYNKYLESFGLHIVDKREFLKVMYFGYFELNKILKNNKKREEFLEKIKNNEFSYEEEAIVRTCLLPIAIFSSVMKYCIT